MILCYHVFYDEKKSKNFRCKMEKVGCNCLVGAPNHLVAFMTVMFAVSSPVYIHLLSSNTTLSFCKYIQMYAVAWGFKKVNKLQTGAYVFAPFYFF